MKKFKMLLSVMALWTYEGSEYEAGTFTANSTSANSPWNTMSLRFNVY